MIQWYKYLYVGNNLKKKEKKIRKKLEQKKLLPGVQLITYASNPKNQLDLIPAVCIRQHALYDTLPVIVGIASDPDEAVEMIRTIAEEVYEKTGDCQIRFYLEHQK
ncbi:MAG: hypothetical protein PHG16_01050 [Lachnospiraceae bacterium]|nr:hypothetical protein [Lachnospiraceae bacterium]